MKQLLEVIKIFLENHFLPAVSAISIALIAIVLIPSDWIVATKLGDNWFKLLLFCLALLLVEGIIKLCQYIKIKINEANNKKEKIRNLEMEQRRQQQNAEAAVEKSLEELWMFTDTLNLQDKKYIDKFLKTDNTPIRKKEDSNVWDSRLLSSQAIHKTLIKEGIEDMYHYEVEEYQYKLRNEIYQLLKLSKEKYGRISHFE